MSTSRWQQLQTLFNHALSLPPDARVTFLDAACRDDPVLRAQVDALLTADAASLAGTYGMSNVYVTRNPSESRGGGLRRLLLRYLDRKNAGCD